LFLVGQILLRPMSSLLAPWISRVSSPSVREPISGTAHQPELLTSYRMYLAELLTGFRSETAEMVLNAPVRRSPEGRRLGGLRLPRESRVRGVAATRRIAVPRDSVVTGRTPNRTQSSYMIRRGGRRSVAKQAVPYWQV